ncbi:MAG: hypothetical protein ACOCUU_03815 [Nanoarchaeota archaeon]
MREITINKGYKITLPREISSEFIDGFVYFIPDENKGIYACSKNKLLKKGKEIKERYGKPTMNNPLSRRISRKLGSKICFSKIDSNKRAVIPSELTSRLNLIIGNTILLE